MGAWQKEGMFTSLEKGFNGLKARPKQNVVWRLMDLNAKN